MNFPLCEYSDPLKRLSAASAALNIPRTTPRGRAVWVPTGYVMLLTRSRMGAFAEGFPKVAYGVAFHDVPAEKYIHTCGAS